MSYRHHNRDKGVKTCSYINCKRKTCPNYTPILKKDSRPFPSCMFSITYREKYYGEKNDSQIK